MHVELQDIPGLDATCQTVWKIRSLAIDGKDPVRAALVDWQRKYPADFKAIYKVMKLAGQQHRVQNPKHIKKSSNPAHGNAYEMIAYTGVCRLMFFYDEQDASIIVCTNPFEKGGDQDAAFGRCAAFRDLYFQSKP